MLHFPFLLLVVDSIVMKSRIRKLRIRRNLTLDELGRRARIERSKLSRGERQYARLNRDELRRIARVLKVRISELEAEGK